ncbi:hypothetical protein QBC33DRAFT_547782 [Phialemonium atrogriseum]|uniref:Uncharacterized protein n=1 Tax=Phialemonium atrogriseum TaxID=1093897 RepID=A0AAJ0BU90_9PEZI|nr:uncharacterized protein QBC33DRAFT_547782 [Phialemonium atrogriseum]KAK1764326.1 hypothetical protein QBC33DRAFT_547782 [Phialemonium atrogriseum]
MKSSRRFTSAKIILKFDDASNNVKNRPHVYAIAPAGTFAINKTTAKRDVHQAVNASLKGEFAGVGGELGYVWDTTKVKEVTHATSLVGVKRIFSDFGKDNGVIWNMEEDAGKGIPSFLRTAVLLRHRDDVPFRFTIDVETGVDWEGKLRRLLGLEKPDPVDPVELDDGTDLEELGIASLDPKTGEDLTNMRNMDIGKQADVVLATLLEVPA